MKNNNISKKQPKLTEKRIRGIVREEISKHEIEKYLLRTQTDKMAKKLIEDKQKSGLNNTDTTVT
jgi:hypothetical protein